MVLRCLPVHDDVTRAFLADPVDVAMLDLGLGCRDMGAVIARRGCGPGDREGVVQRLPPPPRKASSSMNTMAFVGRPVKSIGRAPGSSSAAAAPTGPSLAMRESASTPCTRSAKA